MTRATCDLIIYKEASDIYVCESILFGCGKINVGQRRKDLACILIVLFRLPSSSALCPTIGKRSRRGCWRAAPTAVSHNTYLQAFLFPSLSSSVSHFFPFLLYTTIRPASNSKVSLFHPLDQLVAIDNLSYIYPPRHYSLRSSVLNDCER